MSRKQRILLALWDGGGLVPPLMHVASRLVDRGHYVVVIGDPTIAHEARSAGCEFTPWVKAPHRTSREREADLLPDYAFKSKAKYFKQHVLPYFSDPGDRWTADVLDAIDTFAIDLVLFDAFVLWAGVAAELRKLPAIALSTTPNSIPLPGVRPAASAMLRVPRFLEGARDAIFRWLIDWVYDKFKPRLNEVRAGLGLAPLEHALDQVRRADAVLILTSPVFDYTGPAVPKNFHWVGAPNNDPVWAAPLPEQWSVNDPRPLVVVGLSSTFQDQIACLRALVDALSSLAVRAVVTRGPAIREEEVRGTDNVLVVASAPHTQLLPHTSVFVTHCGHGSAMKGLSFGVPMVCLPMGRDQDDNAARIAELGAGVVVKPTADSATLKAAIERVLHTPEFARRAKELAAAIREGRGQEDATTVIESIALARAAT